MILQSDYIDGLIAEYEAAKSREARSKKKPKRGTSPQNLGEDVMKKQQLTEAKLAFPRITAASGDAKGLCQVCGKPVVVERSTKTYCSPKCRQAAFKQRRSQRLLARLGRVTAIQERRNLEVSDRQGRI